MHNRENDPTVLDLGCGTGAALLSVAAGSGFSGARLFGVDVSSEATTKARASGVETFALDLNTLGLPFEKESIDIVLFMEVIEHLYNSDLVLAEIYRVLRPGGLMVLTTPNLASWANRLAILLGFQPFSVDVSFIRSFGTASAGISINGHVRAFTLRALREYVAYFGFVIAQQSSTVASGVPSWAVLPDRIFSLFPSLASHIALGVIKPLANDSQGRGPYATAAGKDLDHVAAQLDSNGGNPRESAIVSRV